MSNQDEKNLGDFYALVVSEDKSMLLPSSVTKDDLKNYVEDMVAAMQPRKKRTDGRPSLKVDDYKIPMNYFMVDSNLVSFHSTRGVVYIPEDEDEQEVATSNTEVSVPNKFREDDLGCQLCLHIFKHGRKTLEELIAELSSYDKNMIVLLVNKLILDKYLQPTTEVEDGKEILTLELIPKEEEKKKLE